MGLAVFLVSTSLLIIGCPSNNSPSSPSAPAPTNTVCTDGSGHTCTPSATGTPTSSATSTSTGTTTSTATVTDTRTPTGTPTQTKTSTATATITNTATVTPTATITDTPTDTGTPTLTGTPTNTFPTTPTSTPTNSPTGTPSPTYSPTPDCTGTYSISGNISYTGSTVGGSNLALYITTSVGSGGTCPGVDLGFGSTSGSYSASHLPAGSYYIIGLYGTYGSNGPNLGDYASAYNGSSNTCNVLSASQITVSAGNPNSTGVNLTFDSTYQLWGLNVEATYTGSQINGSINAAIYSDSGYTNKINSNGNISSGSSTSLIDAGSVCSAGGSSYLMVWYGQSNSGPQSGDAYIKQGLISEVNNSTITSVSFGDTNIWP